MQKKETFLVNFQVKFGQVYRRVSTCKKLNKARNWKTIEVNYLSWKKFDENTLTKIKQQKEFEEQTAKKLTSLSESAQNPLIKALLHSIVLDTTKHAETYKMLIDLNSSALLGKENESLGKEEIATHVKEEARMLKQAIEISEEVKDKNIKQVVLNIVEDERKHHKALQQLISMFEKEAKEWDAYFYDLMTGFP
jgi:rubrerythrin